MHKNVEYISLLVAASCWKEEEQGSRARCRYVTLKPPYA
jgi:hypothetical protein